MADKVVELQSVLDAKGSDSLARELAQVYDRWRIQKFQKIQEWKELYKYIFATDTSTTTNSTLPWNNKTTIPKLAQIRDNLHANYMDALFPNDDWLVWVGDDSSSVEKEKRKAIEAYTKNKALASGIIKVMSDLIYDYIDYGNAFAEVIWVEEKHRDAVTGDEEATYIGPKVRRISPYDHVFDPTAPSYDKAPKFTRYLKSIGELKKEIKERPDLEFDEEVVNKIVETRRQISVFDMEDIDKADGYIADGFGTLSEYLGSGLVEILEFEGTWYDSHKDELHENKIITIADGDKILRVIDNPNWMGRSNKVHVGWRDRPDNLWAMGPLDNLVGMQYRLDHLENLKADAMDFTIRPPKKIIGEVPPFEWAPDADIHIPEDGDVIPMPPNPAAFQVNNEIAYLLNLMEEMAGAPRQAMGIRTPGEKTAFEVQTLENNAGRIFNSKTRKFEIHLLEPIMNLFLEAGRRNIDVSDTVRILDEDFGVEDFITITKEDITAKGKIRPMGARHFAARAQLIQNLNGVFASPMAALLTNHTSRVALFSLIEEVMGLQKFQLFKENIGVVEDKQTQSLVQQGQIDLETEATTPVEENLGF